MPQAGWCAQCGRYVWVTESGSCENGHDAGQVSNIYETEPTGDPLRKAADDVERAAAQAGEAVKGAWSEAQPAVSDAADAADAAARKAGAAAKKFGSKLWEYGKKQGRSSVDHTDFGDFD